MMCASVSVYVTIKKKKKSTLMGLEPTIFASGGRRGIHFATRPKGDIEFRLWKLRKYKGELSNNLYVRVTIPNR